MTIETILCCFVADEEMFPPEKRFADGGLAEVISSTATVLTAGPAIKEGTVAASTVTTAKIAPTAHPIENH